MTSKLFSAKPARIGRFDGPPTCDAVSTSLVEGTPADLKADLIALLGKANVLHRAIDLVRYASDASPYRLVPQVVVLPRTTDDIVKLFRYCRENRRHATFRAAADSRYTLIAAAKQRELSAGSGAASTGATYRRYEDLTSR